jgi:hypothetical protein|tara:strand:+ start:1947 stop:2144 length:198 start_codon:yes stop_codon:yes gene_type:complete
VSRTKQLFNKEREMDRHLDDDYHYEQSKLNRERESKDDDAIVILTNFFNTLAESYGVKNPQSNED